MPKKSDMYSELLAAETGTIVKAAGRGPDVALVYPNSYHVGMSSLGFQVVYGLGNQFPGARVERYFHDLPVAETLESRLPIARVDVVAFSVSFVMDYLNVLDVLDRAGLPMLARERSAKMPLVVAGGTAIQVNRLPIYDVCDVLVLGAAERTLGPLLEACAKWRNDRPSLLRALSALPGVEVTAGAQVAAGVDLGVEIPSVRSAGFSPYSSVRSAGFSPYSQGDPAASTTIRAKARTPNECALEDLAPHPAHSVILTDKTEFAGKCLIEISRGCPYHCTFCWAGHNIIPYIAYPAESVIAVIEEQRARARSFGFIAAAVGAHPGIDEICAYCDRHDLLVSFSSLRVEDVTKGMLRSLARSGQRSITLAPETASPRLRRLLGKRIEDESVFGVVERAVGLGMRDVRLYFMVGLPTENDEEAAAIAEFVARLRERFVNASRPKGAIGTITINCGVYVPYPNTPLPRIGPPPEGPIVRARLKRLVRALRAIPNVHAAAESVDLARAQGILANGDRRALDLLRLAHERKGHWRSALRAFAASPAKDGQRGQADA